MNKYSKPIFWILLAGLILFTVSFGLPFVSGSNANKVLTLAGCKIASFDLPASCPGSAYFAARFIPLSNWFVSLFIAPGVFIQQFWDILLLWVSLIVYFGNKAGKQNNMKQFKVFKHPTGKIQAVKQGWSWPAFFFDFIWAMGAKMWGLGVGMMLVFFIVVGPLGKEYVVLIALFIVAKIIFGVNGNTWRDRNLLSRGFELKETVTAANKDDAIALFLKNATA